MPIVNEMFNKIMNDMNKAYLSHTLRMPLAVRQKKKKMVLDRTVIAGQIRDINTKINNINFAELSLRSERSVQEVKDGGSGCHVNIWAGAVEFELV